MQCSVIHQGTEDTVSTEQPGPCLPYLHHLGHGHAPTPLIQAGKHLASFYSCLGSCYLSLEGMKRIYIDEIFKCVTLYHTISIYNTYTFSIFPYGSPPSKRNVCTGSHAQLLDYSRFTQPLVRWYDPGQDECCTPLSDNTLDEV